MTTIQQLFQRAQLAEASYTLFDNTNKGTGVELFSGVMS